MAVQSLGIWSPSLNLGTGDTRSRSAFVFHSWLAGTSACLSFFPRLIRSRMRKRKHSNGAGRNKPSRAIRAIQNTPHNFQSIHTRVILCNIYSDMQMSTKNVWRFLQGLLHYIRMRPAHVWSDSMWKESHKNCFAVYGEYRFGKWRKILETEYETMLILSIPIAGEVIHITLT